MSSLDLASALRLLCDDALFLLAATGSVEPDHWADLARRRAPALADAARGLPRPSATDADPRLWALGLVREAAPVAIPIWMPMSELVTGGISLATGPRGVRSLFSSKPSEKEILRVRRTGALALRVLGATLAADGSHQPDERFLLDSLAATLGLDPAEESTLRAEPAGDAVSFEVLGDLEPKVASQVLRGAWTAALRDGLDAREEGALATIASRLALKPEEALAIATQAREENDQRRLLGRHAVDMIYWVLGDELPTAQALAVAVTTLLTPEPERSAVLAALAAGAPPTTAQARASLGRPARAAALAFAWVGALRTDPRVSRRAELVARHDRVAEALGGDGPKVRAALEASVERDLSALVAAAAKG